MKRESEKIILRNNIALRWIVGVEKVIPIRVSPSLFRLDEPNYFSVCEAALKAEWESLTESNKFLGFDCVVLTAEWKGKHFVSSSPHSGLSSITENNNFGNFREDLRVLSKQN
jgi:hypothetical protein